MFSGVVDKNRPNLSSRDSSPTRNSNNSSPTGSIPLLRVPSNIDLDIEDDGGADMVNDDKSFTSYPQGVFASSSPNSGSGSMKTREKIAWFIIAFQAMVLCSSSHFFVQNHHMQQQHQKVNSGDASSSADNYGVGAGNRNPVSINNRPVHYHESQFIKAQTSPGQSFFDPPTFYPPTAGLVSRVWHSNGSPNVNDGLQQGSCWCSGDDYCMCTPSLAIDVILTSGPDHVYMVERRDSQKFALMGGYVEVGETVEEAARRELQEEMNVDLPVQELELFGVYSDPQRDFRKHAVSVVFVMDVPPHVIPKPGDDALQVHRMDISDDKVLENLNSYIDHKTVLRDFRSARQRAQQLKAVKQQPPQKEKSQPNNNNNNNNNQEVRQQQQLPPIPRTGDEEPFKRSVCPML
mmetsp:Transcript_225/g.344  ORF Transcript_225/g.344 Transcript_225/m.344 type:complete len:405 (-) Transcript_225:152-1366(-)|eukprot:CAMPEP_0195287822 /NCGR_PEP_ID=MMETSP0707-20130614/4732_1 /TAXON_ID=33640 /ORGANISM="Asterionellopsis glacialis, Strain CCMP134" /LENGTH=404 /DNA_ID=CAMNT_0040347615 /DNA_START=51 /DNA_END=1265 /DNA_ORIENTATION=+